MTPPGADGEGEEAPPAGEDRGRTRRLNRVIESLLYEEPEANRDEVEDFRRTARPEEATGATEFSPFERVPGLLSDREAMAELIDAYGPIRGYFMARPGRYRSLQRSLNQARMGTTHDRYLSRLLALTVGAAVLGALLGALGGVGLSALGVFASLSSPVGTPGILPGGLVEWLSANRAVLGIAVIALLGGAIAAAGTWYGGLLYPGRRAQSRAREIDFVLPDAIVFMYALSESGMNLVDIIGKLADSRDAYGDVAAEFDLIRRDVHLYGNDLYTSLRNTRNLTPSDNLEKFLDDLLSLLDSGGDVTTFLNDQSERYLDRAQERQTDFLNLLAMLSEVFIVGFVATPLFLIVIMMVISLLGGSYLLQMAALIYVGIPLAFVGFGVFLSVLLEPYVYKDIHLDVPEIGPGSQWDDSSDADESDEFGSFRRRYRLRRLRQRLSNPLGYFRANPMRTLLVTGPLTVIYLGGLLASGLLPLSVEGWTAAPIAVTNRVVVAPFLLLFTPLTIGHELERRRRSEISRRFPNTLNVLSSANSMGISLSDALGVVSQWSSGFYARELQTVRNDIEWTRDTSGALLRLANRLRVPSLMRTIKLIAEGRRTTTDLSKVLRIAAEDTRNRFRLIHQRRQEMLSYIAVVIVSFLVFVGVVLLLDVSYLTPIAQLSTEASAAAPGGTGAPTSISSVPVATYRTLFYHAVVVQAIGSGLVSGILSDNELRSGLKYSIALLVVAAVAFTVI